MIAAVGEGPDPQRSRLRAAVAAVKLEIASQPAPVGDLAPRFAQLVELLALGVEPEVRECPICGRVGMRDATLCGYCWTKLTPPPR